MEDGIAKLRNAGTEQDLGIQYKALKPEVDKLNIMAAKRQQVQSWFGDILKLFILLPTGKNPFCLSFLKVPVLPSANIVPLKRLIYQVSFQYCF